MHNAPGPNVQMPDLAVAHLPLRQSHKRPAGVNERVGILAQQPVVSRFARERDGIGFGFGTITPAVENDKNEWFRTRHKNQLLAPSVCLLRTKAGRARLQSCHSNRWDRGFSL